jgi:heme-degrading monooxygenase HmoA
MFSRQVTMRLKKGAAAELARVVEREVIPLMRSQKGFRDEITLVAADRLEAVSTSFWDTAEDVEEFNLKAYHGVLESLSKVVEKNPKAATFEVINSTLHGDGGRTP